MPAAVQALEAERSFDEVWRAVGPRLQTAARPDRGPLNRTAEDEEGLTQDIAVVVWKWARRNPRIDDPFAFGCKVKPNFVGHRLTRRSASTIAATEAIMAAVELQPEEQVAEREGIRDLEKLLSELDWRERRVLELCGQGVKHKDIAMQVGVPVSQVRVIGQRGRRKLGRELKLLRERGRCRMLALTIAGIASGRIDRSDRLWLVGQEHLKRCRACNGSVNSLRRAGPTASAVAPAADEGSLSTEEKVRVTKRCRVKCGGQDDREPAVRSPRGPLRTARKCFWRRGFSRPTRYLRQQKGRLAHKGR
jgi:RNA polymerase sigma factor (sigma-70 family)